MKINRASRLRHVKNKHTSMVFFIKLVFWALELTTGLLSSESFLSPPPKKKKKNYEQTYVRRSQQNMIDDKSGGDFS